MSFLILNTWQSWFSLETQVTFIAGFGWVDFFIIKQAEETELWHDSVHYIVKLNVKDIWRIAIKKSKANGF